jgi:hypothetical protein
LSRLRHPVARALRKFHCYGFAAFVVLHGDYGCFRRAPLPISFQSNTVVEFQGQGTEKDGEISGCEFNGGGFTELGAPATQGGHMDRHAEGNSLRKKARQLIGAALLLLFLFGYGNLN